MGMHASLFLDYYLDSETDAAYGLHRILPEYGQSAI